MNGHIRLELPVEYGLSKAITALYPYHRTSDCKAHRKVTVSVGTVRIHCTTDTVTIPTSALIGLSCFQLRFTWTGPIIPSVSE